MNLDKSTLRSQIFCHLDGLVTAPVAISLLDHGVIDDFKRILSSEYSGLISHLSEDPKKKIDSFFNYFKRVLHAKPKNPKSLDTGRK